MSHIFNFTLEELKDQLGKLKNASAGVDRMTKACFPDSDDNLKKLLSFCNALVFSRDQIPNQLRQTILYLIPKTAEKMRGLCVGTRLSALIDRLMASRVEPLILQSDSHPRRFGFLPETGVEEHLGSTFSKLDYFKNKGYKVATFQADIEGAYDNVPHVEAVLSMHDLVREKFGKESGHEYLVWYTMRWIHRRTVCYSGQVFVVRKAIPQGSPFSCIVFVTFLNYNPPENLADNVWLGIFADDVTFIVAALSHHAVKEILRILIMDFTKWLNFRQMSFAPDKSLIHVYMDSY